MLTMDKDVLKKHCVEFNVLRRLSDDLCKVLPIDDLFPNMISKYVIDFEEKAEICAERTELRRVRYFLDNYLMKGLDYDKDIRWRFKQFLTVMKESHKCDELINKINYWMEQYRDFSAKPDASDPRSDQPSIMKG